MAQVIHIKIKLYIKTAKKAEINYLKVVLVIVMIYDYLIKLFCVCAVSYQIDAQICNKFLFLGLFEANGQDIDIVFYPFQASIRYSDKHICSGVIVDPYTILTAAHCVKKYVNNHREISVRVCNTDDRKGDVYLVSKIHIHPNYTKMASNNNDIGLLKVLTFIVI